MVFPGGGGGTMTSAWAGWRRFYIPVEADRVHSLLVCISSTLESPTCLLAGRKILIDQNIKTWTGPALCVFSLFELHNVTEHNVQVTKHSNT
jgi:hypothetical protein